MTSIYKNTAQKRLASAIAELATCNPFLPQRIESEKLILGKDFKPSERIIHKLEEFETTHPNLGMIIGRVRALLEELESQLSKSPVIENDAQLQEYSILADVIKFHVYHEFRLDFDQLIDELEKSSTVKPNKFYSSFERSLTRWSSYLPKQQKLLGSPHFYFSFFFQIRRAFYHIFNHLLGNSLPIAKLRGEVWQSIFSENLKRYETSLFDKMSDMSSLILGPTGSGKEIVAKAIGRSAFIPFNPETKMFDAHHANLFIPLNVSAMAPTLVESELFGHSKGAFTGAEKERPGFFETCHSSGTVFLDEIGELDLSIQVKLLRVLQDRNFYRLGEVKSIPFKGRVIAATHRNLDESISDDRFREDLYFRLCSDIVRTPSLKEQIDDTPEALPLLVRFLSKKYLTEEPITLELEVTSWIQKHLPKNYHWPGNVRELEQITRGVLMKGSKLDPKILRSNKIKSSDPFQPLRQCSATMAEAMTIYTKHVHQDSDSYQETARRLEVDHRTVKKYL